MNKQEHEENIAILKSMIPEYEMKNKVFGVKALREAISALDKQIPKRPHHMYRVLGEYELFGECPHCGHSGLRQGFHQCCWWCGQKLDWRNEDE